MLPEVHRLAGTHASHGSAIGAHRDEIGPGLKTNSLRFIPLCSVELKTHSRPCGATKGFGSVIEEKKP